MRSVRHRCLHAWMWEQRRRSISSGAHIAGKLQLQGQRQTCRANAQAVALKPSAEDAGASMHACLHAHKRSAVVAGIRCVWHPVLSGQDSRRTAQASRRRVLQARACAGGDRTRFGRGTSSSSTLPTACVLRQLRMGRLRMRMLTALALCFRGKASLRMYNILRRCMEPAQPSQRAHLPWPRSAGRPCPPRCLRVGALTIGSTRVVCRAL